MTPTSPASVNTEAYVADAEAALARVVRSARRTGKPFTVNDVRKLMDPSLVPHHPNVLGSVFSTAAARKEIRSTGKAYVAEHGPSKGHLVREWVAA